MKKDNVAIIGAGPAGLSCALYLLRAGINPTIFEKKAPGGVLNEMVKIDNYPGFTEKSPSTLAFRMYSAIEELGANIVSNEVLSIKKENDDFIVKTNDEIYSFKFIVIASGRTPKKLPVLENLNIKKGVSYCVTCDGALYKNKDVVIVGSGASAVIASIYLSNIAHKIYMVNRSDKFKCELKDKEIIESKDNIEIIYDSNIDNVITEDDKVVGVNLDNNRKLDIECIFVYIGQIINNMYYENLKLNSDNLGILVDNNMKTSLDRVYAIGDSVSKRLYQVVTAASEGALAATDIIRAINR